MTTSKVSLTMHSWHTYSLFGSSRVLPGRFCTTAFYEARVALTVRSKPLLLLPARLALEVSGKIFTTGSVTLPQTHTVMIPVSLWSCHLLKASLSRNFVSSYFIERG